MALSGCNLSLNTEEAREIVAELANKPARTSEENDLLLRALRVLSNWAPRN